MSGGQEVGTGYVTLLPSAKGFSRGVESELKGSFDAAEAHGSGAFQGLFSKAVKWAAGAAVAIGGYFVAKKIFGGGLDRLLNIEDAQAKLKGLGHDAKSVSSIMADALASVRGTAYGLDAAATTAAGAVAAGIKPGQELQKYLKLTADAASIAGVSMNEMGSIFNRVQTQGRAYTMELNMLADRGIPIYQWLADEYGVTATELRKMVAAGKVDSETYRKVIEKNIGGAALSAGDTTRGALRNLGASLARVGANLLGGSGGTGGVFSLAVVAIKAITSALGPVEDAAKRVGDAFGAWTRDTVEFGSYLVDLFGSMGGGLDGLQEVAEAVVTRLVSWLMSRGTQQILDAILAGRQRLFDAALQLFPVLLDAAVQIMPQLVAWLTGTAIPQLVAAISAAVPLIVGMIQKLVPLIVQAVTTLVPMLLSAGVDLFMALVQAAAAILPVIVSAVVALVPQLVGALVTLLPQLITALVGMVPQLLTAAIQLFTALVDAVVQIVPQLLTQLIGLLPVIVQTVVGMLPQLLTAAVQLFLALVQGLLAALPELLTVLLGVVLPQVLDTVLAMLPDLLTTAIDLFLALVDAVLAVLPQLIEILIGTVLPQLLATIVGMTPRLMEVAVQLFLALVEGIIKVVPRVLAALLELLASLIAAVVSAVPQVVMAGVQLLAGLLEGTVRGAVALWTWLKGLPGRIVSSLGSLAQTLYGAGVNLLQGFIEGVKSMAKRLLDAVLAPIKNAIAAVKDFLGIHSPSTLMASIAGYTVDGYVNEMDRYGVAELQRITGRVQAAIEVAPAGDVAIAGGQAAGTAALLEMLRQLFAGGMVVDLDNGRAWFRSQYQPIADGLAFDAEFVGVGS